MNKITLMLLPVLLQACASTPSVTTDSDPDADFSAYGTFTWLQPPQGPSPLQQQRIVEGVNAQLRARGWQESGNADVAVAAHVATEQRHDVDTFYSGPAYAGWGWHGAWGMGGVTTTSRTYEVGTLVVDLFDAKTRQAIWRGTAEGTVPKSPGQIDERVQAGIAKMFANFPPGR